MRSLILFAGTLDLDLVSAEPERVEGSISWAPERCTSGGVLHGGALMVMADDFGGVCAFLNLPPGTATSKIDSKTNFFRAVREGHVSSVSCPLHVGRSTIVVQKDLFDEAGKCVAQTTQ